MPSPEDPKKTVQFGGAPGATGNRTTPTQSGVYPIFSDVIPPFDANRLSCERRLSGRIGVMIGFFNPVHNGHTSAARTAMDHYDLSAVVFSRHSQRPTSPLERIADEHRAEMLRVAIADEPRFLSSDALQGLTHPNSHLAYLTALKELNQITGTYLIIGSDYLVRPELWFELEALYKVTEVVVISRGHLNAVDVRTFSPGWECSEQNLSRLRSNILFTPAPAHFSSSAIREAIEQADVLHLPVHPGVLEMIKKERLYRRTYE